MLSGYTTDRAIAYLVDKSLQCIVIVIGANKIVFVVTTMRRFIHNKTI